MFALSERTTHRASHYTSVGGIAKILVSEQGTQVLKLSNVAEFSYQITEMKDICSCYWLKSGHATKDQSDIEWASASMRLQKAVILI